MNLFLEKFASAQNGISLIKKYLKESSQKFSEYLNGSTTFQSDFDIFSHSEVKNQ
jgi:hypothetical protein